MIMPASGGVRQLRKGEEEEEEEEKEEEEEEEERRDVIIGTTHSGVRPDWFRIRTGRRGRRPLPCRRRRRGGAR